MTKKEDESKSGGGHETRDMSARRARLRTSLNKQPLSSESVKDESIETGGKSSMKETTAEPSSNASLSEAIESMGRSVSYEPVTAQVETFALLSHIEQSLNSCAGNLASMQKMASQQIEELKVIAETLQSQSVGKEVPNLNPLMESLTAAIEPMKAIGELVPALDRLANAAETYDQFLTKPEFSNDKLVISLSEQLLAGNIDPLTFKSAYQAIFPGEDIRLLTHRLGELLDEQQLSGDLFQVAFQALQSNQFDNDSSESGVTAIDQDSPLPEEERREFLVKEEEFSKQLVEKDAELDRMRQQLEGGWDEMTAQCEELKTTLRYRDDLLREKEAELNKKISELIAKDSENQQLKAQIEEMTDKTKEMMTDLQRQLAKKQEEEIARKNQEEIARKQEQETSSQANKSSGQSPQSGFLILLVLAVPAIATILYLMPLPPHFSRVNQIALRTAKLK